MAAWICAECGQHVLGVARAWKDQVKYEFDAIDTILLGNGLHYLQLTNCAIVLTSQT